MSITRSNLNKKIRGISPVKPEDLANTQEMPYFYRCSAEAK